MNTVRLAVTGSVLVKALITVDKLHENEHVNFNLHSTPYDRDNVKKSVPVPHSQYDDMGSDRIRSFLEENADRNAIGNELTR